MFQKYNIFIYYNSNMQFWFHFLALAPFPKITHRKKNILEIHYARRYSYSFECRYILFFRNAVFFTFWHFQYLPKNNASFEHILVYTTFGNRVFQNYLYIHIYLIFSEYSFRFASQHFHPCH